MASGTDTSNLRCADSDDDDTADEHYENPEGKQSGGVKGSSHHMENSLTSKSRSEVPRAWTKFNLHIRYKDETIAEKQVILDIPPCKLQFVMESENMKQSLLLRLKKTMTLEKSRNTPETVNVTLREKMTEQKVMDSINKALSDKDQRQLSFETEQIFNQFLHTYEGILKSGTVGIYIDSTVGDLKVNLIGSGNDIAAIIEDMSKQSDATGDDDGQNPMPPSNPMPPQNPKPPPRNSGIWIDQQRNLYVEHRLYDIDTIQYLHFMNFKSYLAEHCHNASCADLPLDNRVLEITGLEKGDVIAAIECLSTFLKRVVKTEIPVTPMVVSFLQSDNVFLHLQKKLQKFPAYLQVVNQVVLWTDDDKFLKEAERLVLDCIVERKVTGRIKQIEELHTIVKKSRNRIEIHAGKGDDEHYIIYLVEVTDLASQVIDLFQPEPKPKNVQLDEYALKYAMAANLENEIKKALPDVEIKFCTQSMSAMISAEEEKDIIDARKELAAYTKQLKNVKIKGLSEGIEKLIVRTHISNYVADKLKKQFLLFLKEEDRIICIGNKLGSAEKMKEDIEKKCFMFTDIRKDFLITDYGKGFIAEHVDRIFVESLQDKPVSKNSSRLCFTRDLEHTVDEFVQKCSLQENFQKKCNPATSDFLHAYGSTILSEVEKKHSVEIAFENGMICFKGNYKNGEKASLELEKRIPTDYLHFRNGERHKKLLESEAGKKSLDDITSSKKCCWSMTCLSDTKAREMKTDVMNGVNHLTTWVPFDDRCRVSVAEADFHRAEFDVLVILVDNKMCGRNILKTDGSLENYGMLLNCATKQPLELGNMFWTDACERFGSKSLVLISSRMINTSKGKQSVKEIEGSAILKALADICQKALKESMQTIAFALFCDNPSKYLKAVILGFWKGIELYCREKELEKRAHLYICVQKDFKSEIKNADIVIGETCGRQDTRRIVSDEAEGIFNKSLTSVEVKKPSIFEVGAECLVVAVAKNLDFSKGNLSGKVMKEAGDELRHQMEKKYSNKVLAPGEVIITNPGSLKKKGVKKLIFGHLIKWTNFSQKLQVLQQFVTDCLLTADKNDCKSVAFPALCTGNLAYPPRDVAKAMLDGIEKYVEESMTGNIDTVFISSQDDTMCQILSMEKQRRLFQIERSEDVECNKEDDIGDDIILTASDRLNFTVEKQNSMQMNNLGEYVHVTFLPTEKDDGGRSTVYPDNWQLQIKCGPSIVALKDAVQDMVEKCEEKLITSVYVHCSKGFGISFGEQAEVIIKTLYNLPVETYPSRHYNYLSNVSIVTEDETGFLNISDRLLKGPEEKSWLSSFWRDVSPLVWRKQSRREEPGLISQCSVRVKLIGARKEDVDAAKQEIASYLLSDIHGQRRNTSEKPSGEVCAEINPGILKYLDARPDTYKAWIKAVENAFNIQVVVEKDNDNKVKAVGSFESLQYMEDYLEKHFPELPKKSHSQAMEFEDSHFSAGIELVMVKIPMSNEEKSRIMEIFAEEIQVLTRDCQIHEMCSGDDGINVTCNKEKEAHVKAKFYYFKKKLKQMKINVMQFNSESDMTLAKSICSKHCPKHTTCVTKSKKIEIMGLDEENVDELKRTIIRGVAETYEDDKPDSKKVFTFDSVAVYIYCGNILETDVDCIVSASNSRLLNNRGVSKVIATAAGDQYKRECENIVNRKGDLALSLCFTTGPGRLKFKKIVHVNCWMKPDHQDVWKQLERIQNSVVNCLYEAEKLGMKSVALPFICSGASGFDIEICAQQYIRALKLACSRLKSLCGIHFVDVYAISVGEVLKVFEAFFEGQTCSIPRSSVVKEFRHRNTCLSICRGKIKATTTQGIALLVEKGYDLKENETLKDIQKMDDSVDFDSLIREVERIPQQKICCLPFTGKMMLDVFLAVQPFMSESKKKEREIRISVDNILQKAAERGLFKLSLILPRKKKDEGCCFRAICEGIVQFISYQETSLKDISIFAREEKDLQEINKTLELKIDELQRDHASAMAYAGMKSTKKKDYVSVV